MPSRLTIGLVGVFENPHSTSHMISSALRSHRQVDAVMEYDYRRGLRKSPDQVTGELLKLAKQCHLMIVLKGNGLSAEMFRLCAQHLPVYLYYMDWWPNMACDYELINGSRYCQWRSMTAYGDIVRWEEAIGLPVYHIVDGADDRCFHPISDQKKIYDILFVGTGDNERRTFYDSLKMMGFDVHFFGPGFNRFIPPKEFNLLCSQSRIVLNLSRGDADGSTSVRLWNIMCSGALVMTKTIPRMNDCLGLVDGKHLASFGNLVEFSNKAKVYLRHDALRESVGQQARKWVLTRRTWSHTAEAMLDMIRKQPGKSVPYYHAPESVQDR